MMLLDAARRAAGAAGVDDAGEVARGRPLPSAACSASTSASPDDELRPAVELTQSGTWPERISLDPDDVMAFGRGQHRGDQVLGELLVGDDDRPRARIAEDVRVIARGVGGVGRNRDAPGGHDRRGRRSAIRGGSR